MGAYRVEEGTVSQITLDSKNANNGTGRGAAMLRESLQQHKAGRSVVLDKHLRAIAGNKTTEAFADLVKNGKVLFVRTSGDVLIAHVREDLDLDTDETARQLAYADNRTGEVGLDWSALQIAEDLEDGVVLDRFFSEEELAGILEMAGSELDEVSFREYDEDIVDSVEMFTCPKCGHVFPK